MLGNDITSLECNYLMENLFTNEVAWEPNNGDYMGKKFAYSEIRTRELLTNLSSLHCSFSHPYSSQPPLSHLVKALSSGQHSGGPSSGRQQATRIMIRGFPGLVHLERSAATACVTALLYQVRQKILCSLKKEHLSLITKCA